MSQTKAQLIDTLVASLLPASDSAVDIGSNAVRFANIYGDTLYGSGANLTGLNIVTDTSPQLGGNLDVNTKNILFGDSASASDDRLIFGAGSDLQIYHDGTANHIVSTNGQINIQTNSSENSIQCIPNDAVKLYYDNVLQVKTTSTGLSFADDKKATFGGESDLSIYHDGSNSFIDESGTGSLVIRGNNVELHKYTGETYAKFISNGAVELYHDDSKKFETQSYGCSATGQIFVSHSGTTPGFSLSDNGRSGWGSSNDLVIFHDGSNSFATSSTGQFFLTSSNSNIWLRGNEGGILTQDGSEYMIRATSNDSVKLFYDNSKKFETTSAGGTITGALTTNNGGGNSVLGSHLDLGDNQKVRCGASDDLQIYHDGSNSLIQNNTGYLVVKSSATEAVYLQGNVVMGQPSGGGEIYFEGNKDGAFEAYYDNSKKFETTSTGALVTGGLGVGLSPTFDSAHSSTYAIQASAASQCLIAAFRTQDGVSASTNGMIMGLDGNYHYLIGRESRPMHIGTNGSTQIEITTNGDFRPLSNNARDLGSTSLRWRNVYTNDLNLSNEGGANDVDGTWGSYTIQEGAEDLFLVNKRSGKKYKFNLTEVN